MLARLEPEKTAALLRSISLIGQSLAKLEFNLENAIAVFDNEAVLQVFAPEKKNASLDSFAKVMRSAAASGRSAVKLQESATLIAEIIFDTDTLITQLQQDATVASTRLQDLADGLHNLEAQLRLCSALIPGLEKEAGSIFSSAEQARLLSLNANIEAVRAADKWETDFSETSVSVTKLSEQTDSLAQAVAQSGNDLIKHCRTALRESVEMLAAVKNIQSMVVTSQNDSFRLAEVAAMLPESAAMLTDGSNAALEQIRNMAQPLGNLGKTAQSNHDDLRICAENRARLSTQAQALCQARQILTEFNDTLYQKTASLVAAPANAAQRRDEYSAGFLADAVNLDPATANDPLSLHINGYLYQCLTKHAGEYASSSLAINWSCNEDFTTWFFTLRPGVRFHNGRTVMAADVQFSLERMLLRSPYAKLFAAITGIINFKGGQSRELAGLQVIAPNRIRFDLDQPDPNWPLLLSHPAAAILPKEECQAPAQVFFDAPIGSGPFEFIERNNNTLVLRAFEEFCQGRPFIDELKIVLFQEAEECLKVFRQGRLEQVDFYGKQAEMVDPDRIPGQVQIVESCPREDSAKIARLLSDRVRWIGAEDGRAFSLTEAWLTFVS